MRKQAEIREPGSCFNKAGELEMIFVLLGRDVAAPAAIRAWCAERIRCGKNHGADTQIVEAMKCAATMEKEQRAL